MKTTLIALMLILTFAPSVPKTAPGKKTIQPNSPGMPFPRQCGGVLLPCPVVCNGHGCSF